MKRVVPLALTLLLGVGLGYLLIRGSTSKPHAGGGNPGGPCPPGKVARTPGVREGARGTPGRGRAQGATTGALLRAARKRNAQLLADNQRLAARLSTLEQDLRFAKGKPMAWPPKAPARLTREPVLRALNQALQQAGLSGEITDVDCKEYPCVLSGNLEGSVSPRRFKRILTTPALAAYEKDHAETSITTRSGHDSLGRPWQRSHFSIALMLAGPPGTQLNVKRTVYRLRQLLDAATGQ